MRLGDKQVVQVDVIQTGSLGLDIALGINGFPKGRIIEIYGPESSGKTTLAIHAIAESQKQGGIAAFIDADQLQLKIEGPFVNTKPTKLFTLVLDLDETLIHFAIVFLN